MVNHLLETRHPFLRLPSTSMALKLTAFRPFLYLLTSLPPYFLLSHALPSSASRRVPN